MTGNKLGADSKIRIETMVKTNNGFEISETDLKLRGPGDLEGTQQSGIPFNLKLSNLAKDGHILQLARNKAIEIFEKDNKIVWLPAPRAPEVGAIVIGQSVRHFQLPSPMRWVHPHLLQSR